MGSPGPAPDVTLSETLEVFDELDNQCTPLTSSEVAERLGCTRRTAHRKLERLAERGDLDTKEAGAHSRVWWRPVDAVEVRASGSDRFEEFVHAVEDYAIFTLDPDGVVDSWNTGARRIKGYDADEILGEHFSTFYTDEDVEDDVPMANLSAARTEGRVEDEGWRVREDGSRFWANVVITAIHDDDGSLRGFTKVTRDMTERKRAEDERRLHRLVSRSIAEAPSLEAGLDAVVTDICERTDWEYGEVWLPGETGLKRSSVTATRPDTFDPLTDAATSLAFEPGTGLVGQVWRSGAERWVTDVETSAGDSFRRCESAAEVGVESLFCVPVASEEEVAASLLFATTETHSDHERMGELVTSLAEELEGLVSRKRAEDELAREREFLDRLLEASPVGIATIAADGEITRSNPRGASLLGVSKEGLGEYSADERTIYDSAGNPIPPDERPFARVFETGEPVYGWECQIEQPDGERRWVSINVAPISEGGEVEHVVASGLDINARKHQEMQLRRERNLTERLLQAGPVAIMILDADGEVRRINEQGKDLLGISGDEASTYSPADRLVYDEDGHPIPVENHPFARTLETGEPVYDRILRIERPDGDSRWLSVSAQPIRDEDGNIERVITTGEDITELKERERQLREERDFSERVLEAVPLSVLVVNRDGDVEQMNERARDRLDYDSSEERVVGARDIYDADGNPIAPEDRPWVQTFEAGEPVIDWEGMIDLPNGRIWVSVNVVPFGDGDPPERAIIVANNVTKLKTQAQRLERQRDDLEAELEDVFERVSDAFYALDEQWRFTHVNSHAEELIRRREAEVLGESLWEVFPEFADGLPWEMFNEAMDRQEPVRFEMNAESRDAWFEVNAYPSESGLSVYFRDITDRVEREQELERYETVVETVQDGVYTVDSEGRFTMVNEAYAELTGYSREELLGMHASSLVDEETMEEARVYEQELIDGEREMAKFEADVLRADGETIRAEATFAALPGVDEEYERVGVVRDVTERVQRERQLQSQRNQLAELNDLNELVHEISHSVIESSTRQEIERLVCEYLADAESCQFAWIGEFDRDGETVSIRTKDGIDGLDDLSRAIGDSTENGSPTDRALRTQAVHVARIDATDAVEAPWWEHARRHGVRSWAAIPIEYEETLYGVLNVHLERLSSFEAEGRAVIGRLGKVIGHAINAIERKEALLSENVVELEFRIEDALETLGVARPTEGTITYERTITLDSGEFLQYGTVTQDAMETIQALVETLPAYRNVTIFDEDAPESRFELQLTEPPALSMVASHGGRVEQLTIDGTDFDIVVHLPRGADVRRVVEAVETTYTDAEVIAQRQTTRSGHLTQRLQRAMNEGLTEKQRAAIEAAYFAGFFEQPREQSGQEVAESLDISPSTFHHHVRASERKLLGALLDSVGAD